MTNPQEVLTAQELDHLAEVREVCQTVNTAGWQRIHSQMKAWVEEALETMRMNPFASPEIKAAMQMRWSQREAILLGVENYIDGLQSKRKQLLEELEESEKRSVPPYAERSDETTGWENFSQAGNG